MPGSQDLPLRYLLAPFFSPGSEVSCRSPRESVSWLRSGPRRCRLPDAEKPAQLPRPPPHSRRTRTAAAVPTTCCRFRCGWWPRASLDRQERRKKREGRTRAASQETDGARRGTKRAAGGRKAARVVGEGEARAAGRKGPAGTRATRQRGARTPAPPPARPPRGTELAPGAGPGTVAANRQGNGPHRVGQHPLPGESERDRGQGQRWRRALE